MNPTSEIKISSEEQQEQDGLSNNQEKLTSAISVSESEKHLSPTPQIEDNYSSPNNNKGLEAVPLSHFSAEEKIGRTLGISTSSSNKVTKSRKIEWDWEKNWHCQPRQRSDGKFDKYYYRKEPPYTLCRSLAEVAKVESSWAQGTKNEKECAKEVVKKLPTTENGKTSSNKKRTCKSFIDKRGESSTKRRSGSLVGSQHEKYVMKIMADAWDTQQHFLDRNRKRSEGKEALETQNGQEFAVEHEDSGSSGSADEANATQPPNVNDLYDMMAQQYASLAAKMDGLDAMLKDIMELLRHKNAQ